MPPIWRFVYFRVNRDTHLAEDIVAEVVLALVSAAAAEQAIDHPAAWLRTVAQRRIQDHFRAAARVQHLIEQVQNQTDNDDEQDPSSKHDLQLRRESVREAMDELPENYRIALEWKYVDQHSVKDIATRLDISVKSAESILFRARNALRKQLKQQSPPPPPQGELSQPSNSSPDKAAAGGTANQSGDSSTQKRSSIFFASRLAGEN